MISNVRSRDDGHQELGRGTLVLPSPSLYAPFFPPFHPSLPFCGSQDLQTLYRRVSALACVPRVYRVGTACVARHLRTLPFFPRWLSSRLGMRCPACIAVGVPLRAYLSCVPCRNRGVYPACVARHLRTPFHLRTLYPLHPLYRVGTACVARHLRTLSLYTFSALYSIAAPHKTHSGVPFTLLLL